MLAVSAVARAGKAANKHVRPAYASATSAGTKASAFGPPTLRSVGVVASGSLSRYSWTRVVRLEGGCIQFPDPQLEQAKAPEQTLEPSGTHSQRRTQFGAPSSAFSPLAIRSATQSSHESF